MKRCGVFWRTGFSGQNYIFYDFGIYGFQKNLPDYLQVFPYIFRKCQLVGKQAMRYNKNVCTLIYVCNRGEIRLKEKTDVRLL